MSPLSIVTSVYFNLAIRDNPLLQNLNGLQGITKYYGSDSNIITELLIENNKVLSDISALSNLSNVGSIESLIIKDNPLLLSLNGLQGISGNVIFNVFVDNNDSLLNLNGLNNITSCEEFKIISNENLSSFIGLESLEFTGSAEIRDNNALVALTAMPRVYLQCSLIIKDNLVLQDIDVFEEYDDVTCTGHLEITNNPNLSICNTLTVCSYLDVSIGTWSSILIENNAEGCNSVAEVILDCGLIPRNDECDEAYFINIGDAVEAYNWSATSSEKTPSCVTTDIADVWFAFNSGTNSTIDVLVDAGYSMQLWEGNCGLLNQVIGSCSADSLRNFSVSTQTNYYVQVWSCESCDLATDMFTIQIQGGTLSTSEVVFNDDIKLFPNPIKDRFNIVANSNITHVAVYSIYGQRILESKPNALETTFDFEALKSGIYLVKVKSAGKKQTFKVVRE